MRVSQSESGRMHCVAAVCCEVRQGSEMAWAWGWRVCTLLRKLWGRQHCFGTACGILYQCKHVCMCYFNVVFIRALLNTHLKFVFTQNDVFMQQLFLHIIFITLRQIIVFFVSVASLRCWRHYFFGLDFILSVCLSHYLKTAASLMRNLCWLILDVNFLWQAETHASFTYIPVFNFVFIMYTVIQK